MPIKGVLFDFSGTLFRIESVRSWLTAALAEREVSVDEAAFERYVRELEAMRRAAGRARSAAGAGRPGAALGHP